MYVYKFDILYVHRTSYTFISIFKYIFFHSVTMDFFIFAFTWAHFYDT